MASEETLVKLVKEQTSVKYKYNKQGRIRQIRY